MPYLRLCLAILVPALLLARPAIARELTIERILAAPDLSGPSLRAPRVSPDGRRVTFLQGKSDNKDQLDLWEYDLAARRSQLLVDSRALLGRETELSDEEKQRRERQRISALSGIVDYQFAPRGDALLFPLGGDLYYYDLRRKRRAAVRRLTSSEAFETDPRISPRGGFVSFIRDQDLWVLDLASGQERALTSDGGGTISNGMAEFIAQEEMDRHTGYWWSPDDRYIAFTRIDESVVPEYRRFEIEADDVKVQSQRYPAAGTRNVLIELKVIDLASGAVTSIDLGPERDIYLARVDWFPDSRRLAVQRQTRDQRRLELLAADINTGATRVLITETSSTWVELNDELTFLKKSPRFIWASSRTGFRHLYLYDLDGNLVRPLTAGNWMVAGDRGARAVQGVDETRKRLYFTANERSPLERHLYVTSLTTSTPEQVRRITAAKGWHSVAMSEDTRFFLETYSSSERPPRVSLRDTEDRELAMLIENALDEAHPYWPYMDHHSVAEFGTLPAADGQTLYYRLLKPPHFDATAKYPVIVTVYGGPGVQNVTNSWGRYYDQYLAQRGYIVFTLDNRGSGERGVAFETPLHLRMGQVEVADQVRGVEYLRTLPYVDARSVGIFGWSYGGYMTLMCLLTAPDYYQAGVSGAPVTDWQLYDTHYTERYLNQPDANAAGYEASAVLPYVGNLRAPLLVMHGMADDNVLFTHSTRLFSVLQKLNKPFDAMTYPGSKHGLLRHADTGLHGYTMVARFFDEHLRNADHQAVAHQ
ncbi:MAG TPA: alpha/beta fold hydrolase [Steroidobacteraceae bacterium]|nr:alpha/beta fold hydrolase [Steroidobacteraceae bacterium]